MQVVMKGEIKKKNNNQRSLNLTAITPIPCQALPQVFTNRPPFKKRKYEGPRIINRIAKRKPSQPHGGRLEYTKPDFSLQRLVTPRPEYTIGYISEKHEEKKKELYT